MTIAYVVDPADVPVIVAAPALLAIAAAYLAAHDVEQIEGEECECIECQTARPIVGRLDKK